jgi:hypothetical protein
MKKSATQILNFFEQADHLDFSEWKERNALLKKAFNLLNKEISSLEDPVTFMENLISESTTTLAKVQVSWKLRIFSPEQAKSIFQAYIEFDPLLPFVIKNWDQDQLEIEKYKKWKNFSSYT